MRTILGNGVDGAIILNNRIEQDDVEALMDAKIPTVFLDREIQTETAGSVLFDSYYDGAIAAEYCLNKGFKRFGYIMGVAKSYDDEERYQGFKDKLEQAGIKLENEYTWMGNFDRQTSYDATKRFLESNLKLPEVIFAANDSSAIGCMEALQEAGIRIPEDISVMGCDDIELAQRVRPSMTTIRTSFEKQGVQAVEQLIRLIQEHAVGEIEILYGRIIPRESTSYRE